MNKKIMLALLLTGAYPLFSQQAPTGGGAINANNPNSASLAASAWYRGGNFAGNTGGTYNLLGTNWNSPIYFNTGGFASTNFRMKLNGVFIPSAQYPINGYNGAAGVNTTGYLLLGADGNSMQTNQSLYDTKGAYSLLHLNGRYSPVQEFGYRPWMQTGVTLTDNSDLSYVGLRKVGAAEDITETVIGWSDNAGTQAGPDKMVFRFFGFGGSDGSSVSNTFTSNTDLDGLHVAQFTGEGLMGLGNTFGTNASGMNVGYTEPKSLLHLSYTHSTANKQYGYMQVTYRGTGATRGLGETDDDGLRFGIDNTIVNGGLNAYLKWQEGTPFIVQTDWDNTVGGVDNGERIRTSATGMMNVPASGFGGKDNLSRISIPFSGDIPVNQPRAILHIGTNTNLGYAPWMEYGTLVANNNSTIFTGLTGPAAANPNQSALAFGGSNLLFANSALGEVGRIQETNGNWGIGNFGTAGLNQAPTERIDVNGNGRFRDVPAQGGQSIILGLQTGSTANDIELSRLAFPNNQTVFLAGDGTWQPSNQGPAGPAGPAGADGAQGPVGPAAANAFGVTCDSAGIFNENRKVDLNDFNFYFEGNIPNSLGNDVGFGYPCGTILKAKVDAVQYGIQGIAGSFTTFSDANSIGVRGFGNSTTESTDYQLVGVLGSTAGGDGPLKIGVLGHSSATPNAYSGFFNGDVVVAGTIYPSDQQFKTDVQTMGNTLSRLVKTRPVQYNFNQTDFPQFAFGEGLQYGFIAQELMMQFPEIVSDVKSIGSLDANGNLLDDGINFKGVNYNAIIPINTQAIKELNEKVDRASLSDQSIKVNVNDLSNSLDKVLALRGVTFDWDGSTQPQLTLDNNNHVGFIAQEVNAIEPRVTFVDDDGLMHVDYDKLVPVLAEAIEELNGDVQAKDSIIGAQQSQINDLNGRLTQLENCLSGILPLLCQLNQQAIQSNSTITQDEIRKELSVKLSNKEAIVLDQNVPNPFAEQTVINFSIPATVGKAQIHFYNSEGRLIQSVEVKERGLGSLTVFGSDLSFGTYTYTLVADGQIVATKKMVKQ